MAKFWYAYNGVGDPFNVSSYSKFTPPDTPKCTDGGTICAVYATGLGITTTPMVPFSDRIRQYIVLALTSGHVSQPRTPGAKRYVYLKD